MVRQPRLTTTLLARPARQGATLIAQRRLERVKEAYAQLSLHDADTLHELRVAMRRLRSCLRTYRRELRGVVSERVRRSLRAAAHRTNPARDADVQLVWLRQRGGLTAEGRVARQWLIDRLTLRRDRELALVKDALTKTLPLVLTELERDLSRASSAPRRPRPAAGNGRSAMRRGKRSTSRRSASSARSAKRDR